MFILKKSTWEGDFAMVLSESYQGMKPAEFLWTTLETLPISCCLKFEEKCDTTEKWGTKNTHAHTHTHPACSTHSSPRSLSVFVFITTRLWAQSDRQVFPESEWISFDNLGARRWRLEREGQWPLDSKQVTKAMRPLGGRWSTRGENPRAKADLVAIYI